MKRHVAALATATALAAGTAVEAGASTAVVWDDGTTTGSPDLDAPRPSLSLAKLYLGYWVAYHGAPGDQAKVEQMIRFSDDAVASALDVRYPQAIDEIARDFGLTATVRHGRWGATTTSAHDVARFIHEIQPDPVAFPILDGMRTASPVAADGFHQDYGTSRLPGAEGTKFGWSDDRRSATGTVSFGEGYGHGWTAAALTYGDAGANTAEALRDIHLDGGPREAPDARASQSDGPTIQVGPWRLPAKSARELLAPYLPKEILRLIPADWLLPVGLPR